MVEKWDETPVTQLVSQQRALMGKVLEGTGFDLGTLGYGAVEEY